MEKDINQAINHGPRIVPALVASAGTHVRAPVGTRVEEEGKAAVRYMEVNS